MGQELCKDFMEKKVYFDRNIGVISGNFGVGEVGKELQGRGVPGGHSEQGPAVLGHLQGDLRFEILD